MIVLSLSACGKTLRSTDELIEAARKEIPISYAETTEIQFAGMSAEEEKAIAWFISGNAYQMHYYLPMELKVKEKPDEYVFTRTFKPIDDRAEDIAYIYWNNGIAFLINNPNCKSVRFTSTDGVYEETIQQDTYPYVFFYPSFHSVLEFVFLDSEGNELR